MQLKSDSNDFRGRLDMAAYDELLLLNPKLVFVNHISNALGTINPIEGNDSKSA